MTSQGCCLYQMGNGALGSAIERVALGEAACMHMTPSLSADISALQSCPEPPRLCHPEELPLLSCLERPYPDGLGYPAYATSHPHCAFAPFPGPFPGHHHHHPHRLSSPSSSCEPAAFIRKRNERERQRVKCVNEGYELLRRHLPQELSHRRLSKVETLRAAIRYIRELQALLQSPQDHGEEEESEGDPTSSVPPSPPSRQGAASEACSISTVADSCQST